MPAKLKTYKTYSAAQEAANGKPILRIGQALHIVGCDDLGLTEIAIISPSGSVSGHITMRHLNRLGNGNYAKAHTEWPSPDHLYDQ